MATFSTWPKRILKSLPNGKGSVAFMCVCIYTYIHLLYFFFFWLQHIASRILVPDWVLNMHPLQWKHRVLINSLSALHTFPVCKFLWKFKGRESRTEPKSFQIQMLIWHLGKERPEEIELVGKRSDSRTNLQKF